MKEQSQHKTDLVSACLKAPIKTFLFDHVDGFEFSLSFPVQILSYLSLLQERTTARFLAIGSSHNRPWLLGHPQKLGIQLRLATVTLQQKPQQRYNISKILCAIAQTKAQNTKHKTTWGISQNCFHHTISIQNEKAVVGQSLTAIQI